MVRDQVALGVAVLRPEDFFRIGNRRLGFRGWRSCGLAPSFGLLHIGASVCFGDLVLRAIRQRQNARPLVFALTRIDVWRHTEEARLADAAAVGPFGEANLAGQLWPHEMHILSGRGFSWR